MHRKLVWQSLFGLLAFVLFGVELHAGQGGSMTLTDSAAPLGQTATVRVILDNNTDIPAIGYGIAVCHDTALVSLPSGGIENGSAIATADFLFHAINLGAGGFAIGAAYDIGTPGANLPPGVDKELYKLNYVAEEIGLADIEFCTITIPPSPPAFTQVTLDVGDLELTFDNAVIDSGGLPPFTLRAAAVESPQGKQVSVPVTMGAPEASDAFTLGLTHNSTLLTLDSIEVGAALAGLNGGDGPDYFQVNTSPVGTAGGTVACVVSLGSPFDEIDAGTDMELCVFVYTVAPAAPDESTSALSFSTSLGSPPVPLVVSVNGFSEHPFPESGEVFIKGIPIPFFVRGDANGDGGLDISDSLFLVLYLFSQGPTLACSAAGDLQDDGDLDIADVLFSLSYLFQDGPEPSAPYPECGSDTDETDAVACETSQADTCP